MPEQGTMSKMARKRNDKCFIWRIFFAKLGKNNEIRSIFCLKIVERE